jgi:hypothetical protein
MLTGLRGRSAALAAVLAAVAVSSARAESEQATRAVIRGSGSDVRLVFEPSRPSRPNRGPAAANPIGEALRLTSSGADDQSVLGFLQRHQASLPAVVDASLIRELRKAGAGEPVITFLSARVALDVGQTAEGTPGRTPSPAETTASYDDAYPDLVGAGHPFYGSGYGGYGGGNFFGGHGRRNDFFGRPFNPHGSQRFPFRSNAFVFFRPPMPKAPFPMHPSVPIGRSRMR